MVLTYSWDLSNLDFWIRSTYNYYCSLSVSSSKTSSWLWSAHNDEMVPFFTTVTLFANRRASLTQIMYSPTITTIVFLLEMFLWRSIGWLRSFLMSSSYLPCLRLLVLPMSYLGLQLVSTVLEHIHSLTHLCGFLRSSVSPSSISFSRSFSDLTPNTTQSRIMSLGFE